MAEPKLWQILQRIKTNLLAISSDGGTTYFYSPDQVLIVRTWADKRLFNTTMPITYAMRREDQADVEEATAGPGDGGVISAAVDIQMLVSQVFTTVDPTAEPGDVQVAQRMIRDVKRCLFLDVTLGGLANNIALDKGTGALDMIVEESPAGWICGEMTFRISYSYRPGVDP